MANPIVCIESINNVRTSVQGNDPRTWMKACAIENPHISVRVFCYY